MTDFHQQAMLPLEEAPCTIEAAVPLIPTFDRPPNAQLAAQGWIRRFMADSARLAEYVELYTSLGYDVHTEVIQPEEIGPECTDCRLVVCRQFVTLYTRSRA